MHKEQQFTEVIKAHEGVIYKITSVYANGRDDQNDLYQEIVYNLWKGFDSFRGEAKISTWMYRVALNTAFTFIKVQKRRGYNVGLEHMQIKYEPHDPTLELQLKQMYAQIKLFNDLEKGLILLLLEGKKYEEIAQITGLSSSNVGTRISRIKQKLKQQLVKQ